VALTHYCTLLLGCSSGISWAAISTAAKSLPMVQILAPGAYYFNPLSLTFRKLNRHTGMLLELVQFSKEKLGEIFSDIFREGFEPARRKHHQQVTVQFKLFRGIIHNFLKKGRFSEIITFIRINLKENGYNLSMLKYMCMGLFLFPFQLIFDQIKKH
jgi:hypothetical protein